MARAVIAGVGMSRFGKHLDTGLKALGREALLAALEDAGIDKEALEAAYVGNAMAGLVTGQECIRGQVVLRSAGIGAIPVINVENACASASTALHQAALMVEAGVYDTVLALGVEKLYHPDKRRSFAAIGSAVDTEEMAAIVAALKKAAEAQGAKQASSGAGEKRSMFMDFYAASARRHMEKYGTTAPVRRHRGEERAARCQEPEGAVPAGAHGRRGARRTDDRGAADASDVLSDRRRFGRGGDRERAKGARARRLEAGLRALLRAALRLGPRPRRAGDGRALRRRGVREGGDRP